MDFDLSYLASPLALGNIHAPDYLVEGLPDSSAFDNDFAGYATIDHITIVSLQLSHLLL